MCLFVCVCSKPVVERRNRGGCAPLACAQCAGSFLFPCMWQCGSRSTPLHPTTVAARLRVFHVLARAFERACLCLHALASLQVRVLFCRGQQLTSSYYFRSSLSPSSFPLDDTADFPAYCFG